MTQLSPEDHLSRITTIWTALKKAHGSQTDQVEDAQERIISRYSSAVYRYLRKILSDDNAADEVFQEFALKVINGGFRHARPEKGRFRDYLKASVLRLVTDYHRRRKRRDPLNAAGRLSDVWESGKNRQTELEAKFSESCQEEILERAWSALRNVSLTNETRWYDVLEFRANNSGVPSEEIAEILTERLRPQKPFSAPWVRKTLQRARERFADLLFDEVGQFFEVSGVGEIEHELSELGLLSYCKSSLDKRRGADVESQINKRVEGME